MLESIRKSCTECSAPVVWLKTHEMDSELLMEAKQASEWLGEPVTSIWRCTRPACAEVGFFGSVHSE